MQKEIIQAEGYQVVVGENALQSLSDWLEDPRHQYTKIFVLLDENSHISCWQKMATSVAALNQAELIMIDSGEEQKNVEICMQLWRVLSEHGADRKSLLINLGGGVIGDMGAFVAATFKRGIRFIQVPTTLLAMVDASIGGKAGVDLDLLKNQVGLFTRPEVVIIYPPFIETLHEQLLLAGFAEVIKHGLVADAGYWEAIKATNPYEPEQLQKLIAHSVQIKNNIVTEDPKEQGRRKLLNFGHTIGHAIETWSMEADVNSLLHGHAVAIGMVCEAYLSHKITGFSAEELEEVSSYLCRLYPPVRIDELAHHRILELMQHDKKNEGGTINFTLLKAVGQGVVNQTASRDHIIQALKYYRQCIRP